jgi:hypothetical protein
MKYKIEINYNTGDSYQTEHGLKEFLELDFEDLSVAEKNLERIKEHYLMYLELNEYFVKDYKSILNRYADKDWFVKDYILIAFKKETPNNYNAISAKDEERYINNGYEISKILNKSKAEHSIILFADNGNQFQISPFWVGCFESLNSIEIVTKFLKYEFQN